MAYNTTINIKNTDGSNIDLSKRILELKPTLNSDSIINEISTPSGQGFLTGSIKKKLRREAKDYTPSTLIGGVSAFTEGTSQTVASVETTKMTGTDTIITSKSDLRKLAEGKGGDIIPMEVSDFILGRKESDVKWILNQAQTKADAMDIYSTITKVQAGDLYAVKPAGKQPAQGGTDTKTAIVAMNLGTRTVVADDLDAKDTNRIDILRTAIASLNNLGTEKSAEPFYPFSINGLKLSVQKILTNYKNSIAIKDSFTTNMISVPSKNGFDRNLSGLVGFIDGVKVLITKQLNAKVAYHVMSNRVATRDLDETQQYFGEVETGGVAVVNGKAIELSPQDVKIKLMYGRNMAIPYFEEFLTVKEVA